LHIAFERIIIPTTKKRRHALKGFSVIDVTNCYHQFFSLFSLFKHLGDLPIQENGDGNKSRKQNPEENVRNNQGMSQHTQQSTAVKDFSKLFSPKISRLADVNFANNCNNKFFTLFTYHIIYIFASINSSECNKI